MAVTANHVLEGYKEAQAVEGTGKLMLAGQGRPLTIDWAARVIDADAAIDIATFRVTQAEVAALGKTVLVGSLGVWPPPPPVEGSGILHCGYPGAGTRAGSMGEITFGAAVASGLATSVSETDVSTMLERANLVPVLGRGVPPENFDFGGISGGPMLTLVPGTPVGVALAGVVHQGPNTSTDSNQAISGFEIIKARRAHFLLADGNLDRHRWHSIRLA